MSTAVFTIGHCTRSIDELVAVLRAHRVEALADVRLIPRSRRYPHFNDDALAVSLPDAGIRYVPFQSLGGRRRPEKDSINTGWRNASFRGYADFMQADAFARALDELIQLARASRRRSCAPRPCRGGATARSSPTPCSSAGGR
jgi:uncharacterized protein (DUF488 family)